VIKKALRILKIQDDFKNYKLYTGPRFFRYDMRLKIQHDFKKTHGDFNSFAVLSGRFVDVERGY